MDRIASFEGLRLRPLLRFDESSREDKFIRHYNEFYYRYAQASLAVGVLLLLTDFLADSLFLQNEPANIYRVEVCIPLLGAGIAFSFTRFARRHWQPVMAGFIVAVSISLFCVLVSIDRDGGMGLRSWVGVLNLVFLELFAFVILGVQFRYAFAAGLLILAAFEAAMGVGLPPGGRVFGYWSYQVVTFFILTVALGWWRELVLRKDFSTQAALKLAKDGLAVQNTKLEAEVKHRTHELVVSQQATILALAALVETRDNETGNHVRRTQHFVGALARHLQRHPDLAASLTDRYVELLFESAPLHDIGKVGIPDRILLKPGRLDAEEFEVMKTHTTIGYKAISDVQARLEMALDSLSCVQEIALSHHEKWDGTGYPERLAGKEIPLSARLMAVADVYDALISRRVYKAAMSHEDAAAIIIEGRASHFDPDVVDAFIAVSDEFKAIAAQYAD
jgi:response regulator RpfG family c-di-GMP phosphodiesterase